MLLEASLSSDFEGIWLTKNKERREIFRLEISGHSNLFACRNKVEIKRYQDHFGSSRHFLGMVRQHIHSS